MAGPPPSGALTPSGFFLLRTPLLPFDELVDWSTGVEAPAALDDPARLAEAFEHDRRLLRERLTALLSDDVVREAVFVASPDLAEGLLANPGLRRASVSHYR